MIEIDRKKIYFPNLNGLRFLAAFLVIIHHTEQLKSIYKIENYWETVPFVYISGKLGVVFFFVLSGFLITYLLLSEESSFKTISIKQFYIRRILRIWPLYFLIIISAFLLFPNISLFTLPEYGKDVVYKDIWLKLFLYAILCPNLVLGVVGIVPYASHTWSVGTEEQYYLIWPILIKYFKNQRLFLMSSLVFFYVFLKIWTSTYSAFIPYNKVISLFWSNMNVDSILIGCIFAVLFFQEKNILRFLKSTFLFYLAIIVVFVFMIVGIEIPFIHFEFFSVLFGIIILNFATNNKIKISLENKALNYLGTISYGLYMYHPIGVVLAIYLAKSINFTTNWLILPLGLMFSIALAALSYTYFESYFLKLKSKFSHIINEKIQ